jgi:hypothetical protein
MNGTYAAQGQRNQKIQALTFHQVSPHFIRFRVRSTPTGSRASELNYVIHSFYSPCLAFMRQAAGIVAKSLSRERFNNNGAIFW